MSDKSEKTTMELVGVGIEPLRIDETTCSHLRAEFHVEDIGTLMPNMRGKGIRVSGLLDLVTLPTSGDHVTFYSSDGQYSASLTLEQARNFGILLYQIDGEPLASEKGGPFRLVTPGLGDLCANVKNVGQIKITVGSGKDTRPE